ncbi:hypothetical protein [Roseimaritima sediminicola]|uniref:hypothetical protein n=1 Tax=Roseimaritima sediminicola TaxID=2662066 RepID=UPI0012982977|nr:hypothetical protein [Roseimaritima sediminicola]
MSSRRTPKRVVRTARCRRGLSIIEAVVAASMLVTLMGLFATTAYRVDHLWRDISRQRMALAELSNQLETITLLPPEEARQRVASLQVSPLAAEVLEEPVLTGEVLSDSGTQRVQLRLSWQRKQDRITMRMAGWLRPESAEVEDTP